MWPGRGRRRCRQVGEDRVDEMAAAQLAERAAEDVRALAAAGTGAPGAATLVFPSDVYLALGFLTRLTAEAPAALASLSTWLQAETVAGRVAELPDGAYHGNPAPAVAEAASRLDEACALLGQAADAMTQAQTLLRGVCSP